MSLPLSVPVNGMSPCWRFIAPEIFSPSAFRMAVPFLVPCGVSNVRSQAPLGSTFPCASPIEQIAPIAKAMPSTLMITLICPPRLWHQKNRRQGFSPALLLDRLQSKPGRWQPSRTPSPELSRLYELSRLSEIPGLSRLSGLSKLSGLLPVCVLIMQPQQVRSEIAVEVTPHRMDMVCLILRVIVLYQEGRPLDAIIVRLARLRTASPGERDISKLSSSEPLHSRRRDFRRHIVCVK